MSVSVSVSSTVGMSLVLCVGKDKSPSEVSVSVGVGLGVGLLFVKYINQIADGIGWLMDRPVFPPSVYYFDKIPTIVNSGTVVWIVAGAMTIAVAASVLPALRAAMLHPVEALRYE